MAGTPLKRARREAREADQLATFETVKRPALPEPRDTPADYSPDLIPELLTLGANGYAPAEIAAHWCISEERLQEWGKAHQDFAEALNHARAREKAWWLSRARLAIRDDNNRFPAGAWSHVMRARFPEFDDKQTITLDIGSLVVIQRNRPEPLQERTADEAKPLIEGRCVRLPDSLTGPDQPQTNLPDAASADAHPDQADTPADPGYPPKTGAP